MSQHGFMVQSDALAQGMTTSLRRGFNGKRPRTGYSNSQLREGTSPNVLVTYADGSSAVLAATAFKSRKQRARITTAAHENTRQARYQPMARDMAPIGNQD